MDKINTVAEGQEALARVVEFITQGYEDVLTLHDDMTSFVARARNLEAVAQAARALVNLWRASVPEGQSLTVSAEGAEGATLMDALARLDRKDFDELCRRVGRPKEGN